MQEFVADIFGKRIGNTHQNGLVDCQSLEEFDESLTRLKSLWDLREKPYAPSSRPRFFHYFVQYQADVIRYHMRKDLRESVGLGSPPTTFTTNASESINAAIKRKVYFKKSGWPEFNENMKHLKHFVESQREEIVRALSGSGMYRLCPEFSHYGVSSQVWVKMRTEQRRDIVTSFEKAKLPRSPPSQSIPSVCGDTDPSSKVTLSISAEDSGIVCIPLVTLSGMWDKASELLSKENGITAAPGSDPKARMVLSYSQDTPHHICSHSGQYPCDSHCPQWISSQICSHTLAVAKHNDLMNFLQWYVKSGQTPNLSTLSLSGLPRGRGQKGGKPKRQRSKVTPAAPDNFTVRPGIASTSSETSAQQPIVHVSEHHQPLNVSTTISVLPESNSGAHINVGGVIQGSHNTFTSQGDQVGSLIDQSYSQVGQECEHTPLSLSAVCHKQGTPGPSRMLRPPPLLNSQLLSQSSQPLQGYIHARTRPPSNFYQECDAPSMRQGVRQHKNIQRRVHNVPYYGPTSSTLSVPPPLVSNVPSQNVNPFYLKKLAGNIRVCQGCRGSLRSADGTVPSPPFDVVIARLEKRQFRDASGILKTSAKPSAAHYHFRLACIRACEPNFLPSTLTVPRDVACLLYPLHRQHLHLEFGVQV